MSKKKVQEQDRFEITAQEEPAQEEPAQEEPAQEEPAQEEPAQEEPAPRRAETEPRRTRDKTHKIVQKILSGEVSANEILIELCTAWEADFIKHAQLALDLSATARLIEQLAKRIRITV